VNEVEKSKILVLPVEKPAVILGNGCLSNISAVGYLLYIAKFHLRHIQCKFSKIVCVQWISILNSLYKRIVKPAPAIEPTL
jgi:hypothetical protein